MVMEKYELSADIQKSLFQLANSEDYGTTTRIYHVLRHWTDCMRTCVSTIRTAAYNQLKLWKDCSHD